MEKIDETLSEMENILKEMLEGFKRKAVRRLEEQQAREEKARKKKEMSYEGLIKAESFERKEPEATELDDISCYIPCTTNSLLQDNIHGNKSWS